MNPGPPVHLGCAEAAVVLAGAPDPAGWLSADEGRRLETMRSGRRRADFLAARWQARSLLARVEGGQPGDWLLDAPADAPPRVPRRPDLFLSVAHSGGLVACALASEPVGIDLEVPRAGRDVEGLAALCCTEAELRMFDGLPRGPREQLFYELWTLKEAWLKRRGDWLAPARLRELDVQPAEAGRLRSWTGPGWLFAVCPASVSDYRWWTQPPEDSRSWRVLDGREFNAA